MESFDNWPAGGLVRLNRSGSRNMSQAETQCHGAQLMLGCWHLSDAELSDEPN